MLLIFNMILFVIFLVVLPIIPFFYIFSKNFRFEFKERIAWGKYPDKKPGVRRVLVHCASIGEINAACPLLGKLDNLENTELFLTCQTMTGRITAKDKCNADVRFFPLDYYPFQNRLLKKLKPDLIILIETEIWPNFLTVAQKKGIPVISVNSVLSEKAARSYKKIKRFFSKTISKISRFYVSSQEDLKRLKMFGVPDSKLMLSGNIKLDGLVAVDLEPKEILKKYFSNIPERIPPIITCGSTRDGEEEVILSGLKKIVYEYNVSVIIAPRHLNRFGKLERYLEIENYNFEYLSTHPPLEKEKIYLVDSMGILKDLYAVSDVTFVGGTLVPIGGHNILEPIAFGKPVVFGKYTAKVKAISRILIEQGLGFEVDNESSLERKIRKLLQDENLKKTITQNAKQFILENSGIIHKIVDSIKQDYLN